MIDIRALAERENIELNTINTVLNFVDDTLNVDYPTKVIVKTKPSNLYSIKYVIFNSYVYTGIYTLDTRTTSSFNIDSAFLGDDTDVNILDVTRLYREVLTLDMILKNISCISTLDNEIYDEIIWYYTLYFLSSNLKKGLENPYFRQADSLSGGCLSKHEEQNKQQSKINKPFLYVSKA